VTRICDGAIPALSAPALQIALARVANQPVRRLALIAGGRQAMRHLPVGEHGFERDVGPGLARVVSVKAKQPWPFLAAGALA
jgi:hypothetical protein